MNTQLFISILLGITVIILIVIVVNKYKEIRKLNKKIEDDENYRIKKLKEQLSKKTDNLNLIISERDELVRKYHEMSDDYKDVRNRLQHLKALLEIKDKLYELIENKTEDNLKFFSSLVADHLLLQYSISADCLEYKSHPAYVEAKRIRELKETTKGIVERHKIMEYKYEYLINLFPELENYVDDFETLKSLTDYKNVADFQENVDRTINYLTKDEYNNLSIEDRNKLALNRYIDGQKTKWQIGRDYELYIGYEYYREGWQVEYYGIEKQLEDMGRDLIAIKGDEVHVIQCKYWSSSKLIHEKHIAQLYGTTIQYLLSNKHLKKKIFPVFITNI
ncbi:MAG: hypothetical protein C0596_19090 [Marinilabiliales bacterium]|nr:MAG: hypothetical protein C0596_19090 [Marinilabiliales bacterium]